MRAGQQISLALSSYSRAFGLAFSKRFIGFFILPVLLNIAIFWFGFDFVGNYADKASDYISESLNFKAGDFWGAETIGLILSKLAGVLIYVLFIVIFAYTGGYVVIIILTPVFSMISSKTEKIAEAPVLEAPFNMAQFFSDIFRGLRLAVRNFLIETILALVLFFVGFIPVIGWFVPVVMFFISAYFFGFSYFDFTNERRKRNFKQSIAFVRRYKWASITNGALFSLVLFIPFFGPGLSAFVAIISVIAGTITVREIEKKEADFLKNRQQ